MKINRYLLVAGKLQEQPNPLPTLQASPADKGESWWDIQEADAGELSALLSPLELHPLQLARCLDATNDPGVVVFGKSMLMEYPAAFDPQSIEPGYLTILLHEHVLVTIRHGVMPALDDLTRSLLSTAEPPLLHLPQAIYMILDQFADLNAEAQVNIRDQIQHLSNTFTEKPGSTSSSDLSRLRSQVENLVSLIENQLYCISALNASDYASLKDTHRKAYILDLLSETEITQKGVYRLEARVKDLYSDYQAIGSERVEKRLRLLTIISAITLPLGLVAGLLGMNVGGVPGTAASAGFIIVVIIMLIIVAIEYWFFKRNGWFD